VSGAQIITFRRPAAKRVESKRASGTHVTGFACTLEARPGEVVLTADGLQLGLSPEQARELAAELIECANDSESNQTEPKA
jgi:hypothetical protein